MKTFHYPVRCIVPVLLFISCLNQNLFSQVNELVELTLHARSVPKNPDAIRLLPREHELRDGNAAIELLRMPWEQMNFVNLERKMIVDWLEMKGNDPELVKYENMFANFKDKMRRAAYTRDADWDYPIGEQPLVTILLPDAQGMRGFAGRTMSLWIRIQIEKGSLKNAEEGILIQLACARHVCRTPFTVCQLVGAAIARIGFEQFEDLIQHPDSENYYYALSMLPDTLGDFKSAIDLDTRMIRSAMPSIAGNTLPPIGDAKWEKAFNELFGYYIASITSSDKLNQDDLKRQAKIAAEELPALTNFSKTQIEKMTNEEISTRWLIANSEGLGAKYIAAVQLPAHQAIQSLAKLEQDADGLNEKIAFQHVGEIPQGAVSSRFFDMYSVQAFIGCHRTGRDAKLLQIVEAIRHHASQHENQLPDSLSKIDLHLPLDPFTNKPAEYELKDGIATLNWPLIPNLKSQQNHRRSYKIRMAESK